MQSLKTLISMIDLILLLLLSNSIIANDQCSKSSLPEGITKIKIDWLKKNKLGLAKNFYKLSEGNLINVYHHVGIYSFNYDTLEKFVTLKPSKNELIHKLEQWRAIDAGINIGVSYAENVPISVDTKEDLNSIENIIETKNDKN